MQTRARHIRQQLSLATCLAGSLALGSLSACKSSVWDPGLPSGPKTWQGLQVREAADQYFLIEESASANTTLSLVQKTRAAFKRLAGQDPPRGLVLVIDNDEQIPLTSAYEWFITAANAKAVALLNPLPSEDELQQQWLAKISNTAPGTSERTADLTRSQAYLVVMSPFAMQAALLARLLELPEDLEGAIKWGLFAPSDGLSNQVVDELLGLAAQNASISEGMSIRLFRDQARTGVLKQTHIRLQTELFATWLAIAEVESDVARDLIGTFLDELLLE